VSAELVDLNFKKVPEHT